MPALMVLMALSALPGAHAPDEAAAAAVPAIVSATLNGEAVGDIYIEIDGKTVWIPAGVLASRGIDTGTLVQRQSHAGPLVRLPPDAAVAFTLDDMRGELQLSAAASAFAGSTTIGVPRERAGASTPPASLFVNYAVNADDRDLRYANEFGWRAGRLLVQATTWGTGDRRPQLGTASLIVDQPNAMRHWMVGETVAGANALDRRQPVVGVSVAKDFGMNPSFVRYSPLRIQGATASPAVAEVYVNDQLVSRTDVAPGVFEIPDLAAPVGAGRARVIVRDAFGRTQELTRGFYRAGGVLAPGVHDYRYTAGVSRQDWRLPRPAERLLAAAEHRVGVSRVLTVGARAERGPGVWTAGPSAALRLPFGEWTIAADAAKGNRTGGGVTTRFSYQSARFSGGIDAARFTTGYQTASGTDGTREAIGLWVQRALPRGVSLGMVAGRWRDHVGRSDEHLSTTASVPLTSGATLGAALTWASSSGARRPEASVRVSVPFGGRTSVHSEQTLRADGTPVRTVSGGRAMPLGPGWAYRGWVSEAPGRISGEGMFSAQTGFARLEGGARSVQGTPRPYASTTGAVVFVDRAVHFTRPVDDAFAIVRAGGLSGARAYASGQFVGHLGRRGTLVVPSLPSFQETRVRIAREDLSVQTVITEEELLAVPSRRSAARVTFRARELRVLTGRVEVRRHGRTIVPAFGEASLELAAAAASVSSPLDGAGGFFFELEGQGRARLTVQYEGERCELAVVVPAGETLVDLGSLTCDMPPLRAQAGAR